jgi:hypothetical protein
MTASRLISRLLLLAVIALGLQLVTSGLTAGADPSTAQWLALRKCESSDNYAVVSANGLYYGAYQFNLGTWQSVGGFGYPNQASSAEQDYRALYLYRMRGWQPWTCATKLRLPADSDAASRVVPQLPADVAPSWPGTTYAYGDCAPALRTWQLRMNTFGFTFEGTGCYYDKTKAAVQALQAANGLIPNGLIGADTWRAAWESKAPPKP